MVLFTSKQHGMALWDRIIAPVSSSRHMAKRRHDGQAKVFTGQEAVSLILDLNIVKKTKVAPLLPSLKHSSTAFTSAVERVV